MEDKAKKDSREASLNQFLEEIVKVDLVKSFGEIQEAAVDFWTLPKIVRYCLLYCPCILNSGTLLLEAKLEDIIGEQVSKEKEKAMVKNF